MTPNLALTLTYEGISLLSRQTNGTWRALGGVAFDAPDLTRALADLRAMALSEGGPNFTTLLVLPHDQVLFTEVTVPARTTVASAITAHLEGRTPYAVSDLVFDSVASGATHQIAAVARETLSEAEIFAEGHGLRPVGFTVQVPKGAYAGAPDFGDCAAAAKHLQGAMRTPETRAVTITDQTLPEPAQSTAPMFASSRAPTPNPAPTPPPKPKPGADAAARLAKLPPRPKAPAPDPMPIPPVAATSKNARVGLWMTLVLLAALLSVGVWSVLAPSQDAVTTTLPEAPGETSALPPDPFDLLPDGDAASELSGGSFADLNLAPTPDELAREPEPEFDVELVALPTAREVVDIYTTTGVWVGTPDAPEALTEDQLENLYQTTLDATIEPADAVALPALAALMDITPPRPNLPPPPAGTQYELSEDGLVVPTPEGIITPDGVRVIAGTPDVQTQPRPDDLAAPESTSTQDVAAAQAQVDAAVLQDLIARMTAIPPTRKPTDFADSIERAQNDGRTLAELRTPAPRPRPTSVQEQAAEEDRLSASVAAAAAQAAQQASLAGTGARTGNTNANPGGIALAPRGDAPPPVTAAPAETSPNAQRLAGTPAPRARPRNMDVIVATARQRPQSTTSNAPSTTATAVAPAVTRTLPTGSTVARAATQENALPRARVNLIGVFGKPSAPKALVRMRNGRTSRVSVGDRVDGGTVTSIGQGRLTYRKGSRDLVLEMPRI